jgi:single-stranded-DNA-specific exonuclease
MENVLWYVNEDKSDEGHLLASHFNFSPVLANLLIKRGYKTIEAVQFFLSASYGDLHDPFLLYNMKEAVQRIQSAIALGESIVVYGDYDVDGMTSTALLIKALRHLKAQVDFYLPDRMEEGYGINCGAIEQIATGGVKVIISVDCGISALEPALLAKRLGVDLIITDHHECQESLPDAYAIINPKQPLCTYPEKMLAGAGIALKLAQGLLQEGFSAIQSDLIALSALGTIADLAPLTGENRLIAKLGLVAINSHVNQGIDGLIRCAGIKTQEITAGHVGFQIGPRLNASGRLEKANIAVELLLSEDSKFCDVVASELNTLNQARQSIELDMVERCIERIEKDCKRGLSKIIVLKDSEFHVGVVGIAASRLVERYHRPVILLNEEEGILKGSARSVGNFSIFEAIQSTEKHLIHFGGHRQAAGLKLISENFEAFLEDLEAYVEGTINPEDLLKQVNIDQNLAPQDVTLALADQLARLEPYGMGNAKPVFAMKDLMLEGVQWLGADKNHVKLVLNHEYRLFEAIQFRTLYTPENFKLNTTVDLAFYVEKNQFRAVETLQLHVKDIRFKSIDSQLQNELVLAYCSRFLDDLSSYELQVLEKKDLKVYGVVERPIALGLEGLTDHKQCIVALYQVHSAIDLYYHGNGMVTPWMSLIGQGVDSQVWLCPDTDLLVESHRDDLLLIDAPLDPVALKKLSASHYPIYFDLHMLKQQLALVSKLTIERSELGDMYKKGSQTFGLKHFDYSQWMSLFDSDRITAILALRLFIDGGLMEVTQNTFAFKSKPEKFNLYELQLMKNLKNYRINLTVAIEFCEGNKLL